MNWQTCSTEETLVFGECIGRCLSGGECIVLVGDIGAGKTTITKGIARGLAVVDDIQSPTFTISRVYDGRDSIRLVHYDFYRLSDPGLMKIELAESLTDPHVVTVIEWAQDVSHILPEDHLTIAVTPSGEKTRQYICQAGGDKSARLIKKLQDRMEIIR